MRAILPLLASALCGAVLTAAVVSAQVTIVGDVLDEAEHTAVDGVTVQLVSPDGRIRATTTTDRAGRFRAAVPFSGGYHIRAERDGYLQTRTPFLNFNTLRLSPGDTVRVELRISQRIYVLAPLTVTATARARNVYTQNFERRRERGMGGHFITRDEILRRNPFSVTDLLVEVPGVHMTSTGTRGARHIFMHRAVGGGGCPVQVYLDGVLANRTRLTESEEQQSGDDLAPLFTREYDAGFSIDDLVSPSLVEAIEVYGGTSTVPPEFMTFEARCGVVAIWTRSGEGRRRAAGREGS